MPKEKKKIKEDVERELLKVMPVRWEEFVKKTYQERRWQVSWVVINLIEKALQRFIEETEIKEKEIGEMPDSLLGDFKNLQIALMQVAADGYNQALQDIKRKQAKWLKENL